MERVLVGIASLVFGLPLEAAAIALGRRVGLLDIPTEIKPHAKPVPFTGGSAVTVIIVATAVGLGNVSLALAAAGVWLIGFLDDVRSLPPLSKLVVEILLLTLWAISLPISLSESVIAVAAGAILINSFNVIDGLDGLAAGCALAPLLVLTTLPGGAGVIAAAGVGSVLAFLFFNRPPARVFLGDEGSLVLGFLLWALPLVGGFTLGGAREALVWTFLWLFPLVNASFVILYRLSAGRPVLRGDRSHLYDFWRGRYGLGATLVACWSIAGAGAIAAFVIRLP